MEWIVKPEKEQIEEDYIAGCQHGLSGACVGCCGWRYDTTKNVPKMW